MIIAIMDGTRFHVYPRCIGDQPERSKRVTLKLQKGDVLFFRGDLAHCGAKYETENIRLFCYVRVCGIKQKPNSTEAALFKNFRCDKCMAGAYSHIDLSAHKQHCVVAKAYQCNYCGDSFDLANTLSKHISRKHRGEHRRWGRRSSDVAENEDYSEDSGPSENYASSEEEAEDEDSEDSYVSGTSEDNERSAATAESRDVRMRGEDSGSEYENEEDSEMEHSEAEFGPYL
ncbi:hypothetical protein PHMEG_00024415 [Phytophthora megakarya]|uniref:C2H2-type domain-containing protein n=1 Tax=Phytophthora megakarya TaxID=4795 RepID=A0A225VEQ9_9STRA|nr:hypothetical protein PHMEG_00024415 [Phytophthora megakarya]